MFFDLFEKKVFEVENEGYGTGSVQRKKKLWPIIVVATACVVLAFGSCDEKDEKKNTVVTQDQVDKSTFAKDMSRELENTLSMIKGAGKVKVIMFFETFEERIVASNKTSTTENEKTESGSSSSSSKEENILTMGSGDGEKPYVLREKLPVPSGVLVTATGANDEKVRLELYESIKALYGISGHRVKIAPAIENVKK